MQNDTHYLSTGFFFFHSFSKLRDDIHVYGLLETPDNIRVHQKCLDSYLHPKTLKKYEQSTPDSEPSNDDIEADNESNTDRQRSTNRNKTRSGNKSW